MIHLLSFNEAVNIQLDPDINDILNIAADEEYRIRKQTGWSNTSGEICEVTVSSVNRTNQEFLRLFLDITLRLSNGGYLDYHKDPPTITYTWMKDGFNVDTKIWQFFFRVSELHHSRWANRNPVPGYKLSIEKLPSHEIFDEIKIIAFTFNVKHGDYTKRFHY